MTDKELEPARSILAKIGGVEVASKVTGKHVSRIYRWTYSRAKGGTGGVIPHDDATKLLEYARQNGIELTADDFFASADTAARDAVEQTGEAA